MDSHIPLGSPSRPFFAAYLFLDPSQWDHKRYSVTIKYVIDSWNPTVNDRVNEFKWTGSIKYILNTGGKTLKTVAFNGSPNKKGNTYHALQMVADELEKEGIETEIVHVGNKAVRGCFACGQCAKKKNEQCVQVDDEVNEWIQKMKLADGVIIGSPVHFSAIAGTMKSFLDRAFYVTGVNNSMLRHKVGAAVVAVRRSGGLPTFNQLNNFLCYTEMLLPTSNYWNVIHGARPGEALQDEEGKQIMRTLGKNMAWLMKLVEHGNGTIAPPEREEKIFMNFIR